MDKESLQSPRKKQASERVCLVSCFSTELLEIRSEEPTMHVVFVPGNPGVVSYYRDFVNASITAIGHIGHTRKDWENGRMFSLQEQINPKVDLIKQELQSNGPPIILVGHSIGVYICIEVFKRLPQQVKFSIGLYPFLRNGSSPKQAIIEKVARRILGQSYSSTAIDATCSHVLQYRTMRNVIFMAMTEFAQFSKEPDWSFMKKKQDQIALLYGIDDHWGPLSDFEEITKQVLGIRLSIVEEGHTHAFCCTEAGSLWVARHVTNLINRIPN